MKEESDTEKTTRTGSLMVATVYAVLLGATCAIGLFTHLKDKGRGRG